MHIIQQYLPYFDLAYILQNKNVNFWELFIITKQVKYLPDQYTL